MNEHLGVLGPEVGDGKVFLSTTPPGIGHVFLGGFFLAGHAHLFGVDDDDKVARIKVFGKDRLVFSSQNISHLHSKPAQDRAIGINNMPFALV